MAIWFSSMVIMAMYLISSRFIFFRFISQSLPFHPSPEASVFSHRHKIHCSRKGHRHHQCRIEPPDIQCSVQRSSDHRSKGHSQIQPDIICAVRKSSLLLPGQKHCRGLAHRAHDAISSCKESGRQKHCHIASHDCKQQDSQKLTPAACQKKYPERQFVKKIAQTQSEYDQHHCIGREEHAYCNMKILYFSIGYEKRLGGTVWNRKKHDNQRNRHHLYIHQLKPAAFPPFSSLP